MLCRYLSKWAEIPIRVEHLNQRRQEIDYGFTPAPPVSDYYREMILRDASEKANFEKEEPR